MAGEYTPREAATLLSEFQFGEAAARTNDLVRPGVVAAMRARAPVGPRIGPRTKDDPRLRDTIGATRATTVGGSVLTVTSTSDHAGYVIHGTEPHQIRPKGDYPLVFFWARVNAVVASYGWHGEEYGVVEHPGTKPNPFPVEAWAAVRGGVVDTFKRTVLAQLAKGQL